MPGERAAISRRSSRRRGGASAHARPALFRAAAIPAVLAATWLAAAGAQEPAAAPPPPLELVVRYQAPAGCPSGSEFIAALQQHLAAGGGGAVDAEVSLSRDATDYVLALRLEVAGTARESTARGPSCEALMQLAALNASMARTASAGPEPALAREAAALAPSLGPPTLSLASSRPPEPDGLAPSAGPREPGWLEPRRFALWGELRAARGLLPGWAIGQGAGLGLGGRRWSVRASGTWWGSRREVFSIDGGSPIELRFEQQSLELAPCLGLSLAPPLRLEGCALIAGHRVDTDADAAQLTASLGAAALATLRLWRGLDLELHAGLQAPLAPPVFAVEAVQSVYRSSAVQPTLRLALGWSFERPARAPATGTRPLPAGIGGAE